MSESGKWQRTKRKRKNQSKRQKTTQTVKSGWFTGQGNFRSPIDVCLRLPHPPQQRRSKMIHKQSFPPPHPLLPQNPPLLPQQQLNKMMIQRIELHPPSLHPHPPQFVAAKSLMLNPPNFSYTVSYGTEENVLQFLKNKFFLLLRYKNGFAIVKLIITIKV